MKKFSMFVGIVVILSLIFATAAWAQSRLCSRNPRPPGRGNLRNGGLDR